VYVTHFNKERKISGKFTCRFPVAVTQAVSVSVFPFLFAPLPSRTPCYLLFLSCFSSPSSEVPFSARRAARKRPMRSRHIMRAFHPCNWATLHTAQNFRRGDRPSNGWLHTSDCNPCCIAGHRVQWAFDHGRGKLQQSVMFRNIVSSWCLPFE